MSGNSKKLDVASFVSICVEKLEIKNIRELLDGISVAEKYSS